MRYLYLCLVAFFVGIGMTIVDDIDRERDIGRIPGQLERTRTEMRGIAKYLRNYKMKTGHYPTNDKGLLAIPELVKACRAYHSYGHPFSSLRATNSGILTLWGEPFIYENRKGLEPSNFDESGANNDTKRRYSVCVDKGVYIWSVAARDNHNKYRIWSPVIIVLYIILVLILVAVFVLFIKASHRALIRRNIKWRGFFFTADVIGGISLAAFLWIVGLTSSMTTCYIMSSFRLRDPELTGEYVQVLTQYHEHGIISDQAYGKLMSSLSTDNRNPYYRGHHDYPKSEE
jgi:hypothetical protein